MRHTVSHHMSSGRSRVVTLAALALLAPAADAAAARRPSTRRPAAGPKLVTVGLPKATGGAVRLQVATRRALRGASVTVNGRRVPVAVHPRRGGRTVVTLGATHRVRFGRNRVVVRATGAGGRVQTVRRAVLLRRTAPLVGMRATGRVRQGEPLRLSAGGTRAARGGRLAYRWRVVDGPARATARLTGATSARPRLVASHPGRYHVALTVTERGGRRTARAAAACGAPRALASAPMLSLSTPTGAVASTPLEQLSSPASALQTVAPVAPSRAPRLAAAPATPPAPQVAAGCTTQYVSADVAPVSGPMGIAFDSMASYTDGQGVVHQGVRVGAGFYDVPSAANAYAIFLDAGTLEYVASLNIPAGIPGGAESFATIEALALQQSGRRILIVIAYPRAPATLVKLAGEGDDTAVSNEGYQLSDGTRQPDRAGRLTGWLQRSVGESDTTYRLVQPDRVTIDTQVDATATQNTIRVGAAEDIGDMAGTWTSGFHVMVLDPALRPILDTPVVYGFNTTNGQDARWQSAFAAKLNQAANTPGSTVIVQSIGRPRPTTIAALNAAQAIEKLGGTESLFLGLNGSGGYALIGNPPPLGGLADPTASPEASSQWTGGADALSGLLQRRNDSAFEATLADSAVGQAGAPTPDYSFQPVVFQAPTPWPVTGTPAGAAAATYVAEQLDLPASGPGLCAPTPRPDVRAQYCNESQPPGDLARDVAAVAYPAGGSGAFAAEDLDAVKAQLQTELGMVSRVRAAIGTAQSSLRDGGLSSTGTLAQDVAAQVRESIPEDAESAVSGELGLSSAVLYVAGDLAPEGGEALGFVASVLDLASELTEDAGLPRPDWKIQTSAAEAGEEIQERLIAAVETLNVHQDVLVSDFGKLSAAARNVAGPWGVNGQTANDQINAIRGGVRQWLYTAIVPSGYDLVRIPGADPANAATKVYCVYSSAPAAWQPWKKADARSMFFPLNDWAGSAPRADQLMGMLSGPAGNNHAKAVTPQSGLMDRLFGRGGQNAGLVAPWFYERAKWSVQRPKMIQPSTKLKPGVCSSNGW